MSRLIDAFRMLDVLSTHGVFSLQDLAQLLEVNERTVQRIRDTLVSVGYRIETVRGPGGGFRLVGGSQIQPLAFTQDEINHVRRGLDALLSQDTSFGSDFVLALSKLRHQFDLSDDCVSISAFKSVRLNVDTKLYQYNLMMIERAIEVRCRIAFDYHKNQKQQKHYIFEPYELMLVDQIWYVHGYIKGSHQVSFRVTRLGTITLLDEKYALDRQFNAKSKMTNFGFKIDPVHLKVMIKNRDYFSEYIWGEEQVIEWLDDSCYTLSVVFPNEYVAKAFILEGGHSMKVLEPLSLAQWIKNEAREILDVYQ